MFGRSKQGRAKEALRRGAKAVLIGGFFHVDHTNEFDLNEEAAAWLYTEALAHQIYMLTAIFHNTLGRKYKWATTEFMFKAISEAITEYELEQGAVPGGIASFVFRRCAEIDSMRPEQRTSGVHFVDSANKVAELDSSADIAAIAERLAMVTKEYFDAAHPMFA